MKSLPVMKVKYEQTRHSAVNSSLILFTQFQSTETHFIFVCMVLRFDCLFYFSIVYGFQAVNPRISKLTATAAKTCANVSWEYKGPEYVNLYVEYGVAGSKKQLHYWLLISAINFKRLRTFLRIYYGSS